MMMKKLMIIIIIIIEITKIKTIMIIIKITEMITIMIVTTATKIIKLTCKIDPKQRISLESPSHISQFSRALESPLYNQSPSKFIPKPTQRCVIRTTSERGTTHGKM